MSAEGTDLLRLLGAGPAGVSAASRVRPAGGHASNPPLEAAGFAELLAQAERGELRSGIPVTIDDDAGVVLSEAELRALSVAADHAEAQGVRRALVYVGGQSLILDVQTRSIEGPAEVRDGVVAGIDGVIRMDGAGADGAGGVLPLPRGMPVAHPSLAGVLGARVPHGA